MFNEPLAFDYTKCPHNALTGKIIGAAIEVHRTLGPGLLESAYEACLVFELQEKGLNIERQKPLPLVYKNVKLDSGYHLDLIVETKVVVEVKSMTEIAAVHKAQRLCCVIHFLTQRSQRSPRSRRSFKYFSVVSGSSVSSVLKYLCNNVKPTPLIPKTGEFTNWIINQF